MLDENGDSGITSETPKYEYQKTDDLAVTSDRRNNLTGRSLPKNVFNNGNGDNSNSSRTTEIQFDKIARVLGRNSRLQSSPMAASSNEDTPERDRDIEIRRRTDLLTKNEVLKRFQPPLSTVAAEIPSEFTQNDGIRLGNDDLTSAFSAVMMDTPLKSKISIQTLRNGTTDDKSMHQNRSAFNDSSPIRKSTQTFVMTMEDSRPGESIKGLSTQYNTQVTNDMLIPATNSVCVTEPASTDLTRSNEKATQLIKTQSYECDVSESLLKTDKPSELQETSLLFTSPINFASFHQSILSSNRPAAKKENTSQLLEETQFVQSPIIAVHQPNEPEHSSPSTVVSDSESEDARSFPGAGDSNTARVGGTDKSEDPSDTRFKLTYYGKHSGQVFNDQVARIENELVEDKDAKRMQQHLSDSSYQSSRLDTDQEYEQTQELPEICDNHGHDQSPIFESPEALHMSKRRKLRQLLSEEDFNESSTPNNKAIASQTTDMTFEYKKVLGPELNTLTSKDILHKDAVWYFFSDCNYYPGKIVSLNQARPDFCTVQFDKRENEVRTDDLSYLDIRCGDKVHWKMNEYEVIGLESRFVGDDTCIRCIRGFDSVLLKKVLRNGKLGKKVVVDTLASIYMTTEEWMKRTMIELDESNTDLSKDVRRSVRSRSSKETVSPIKNVSEHDNKSTSEILNDTFHDTTLLNQLNPSTGQLFDKCIFFFSGINESGKKRLCYLIELQSGLVSDQSFDKLIKYDAESALQTWIDPQFSNCRFACLIAGNYSRSPKYLEALALGWPVLHWNFIEQCLTEEKLSAKAIMQNLLPSGESSRLAPKPASAVIKSCNVFTFLSNFKNDLTLEKQLNISAVNLQDYSILIKGNSDMDFFIEFVFETFKVGHFEYMIVPPESSTPDFDSWSTQLLEFHDSQQAKTKIIFLNETSIQNTSESERQLSKVLQSKKITDFRMETKEWLVQTIINESP